MSSESSSSESEIQSAESYTGTSETNEKRHIKESCESLPNLEKLSLDKMIPKQFCKPGSAMMRKRNKSLNELETEAHFVYPRFESQLEFEEDINQLKDNREINEKKRPTKRGADEEDHSAVAGPSGCKHLKRTRDQT